jgi:hypothetical protein
MKKAAKKVLSLRKKFLPLPLCLILFIVFVLRIPNLFEPYWYGDEAIYMAVGEGLRQGLLLYRDIFDHKPPAIYLLAALAGSIIWFKFILIVWHQVTLVIFWKFAERLLEKSSILEKDMKKAVFISTFFFAILTTLPTLEGNLVNSEVLMAGPTLLGFYLLWKDKLTIKQLILSGLVFSIAFLLKVPAIFDILGLFTFWGLISIWNIKKIALTIKDVFFVSLGILIPIILMTLYFWQKDAMTFYLQGFIGQNVSYVGSWATPKVGGESGGLVFRAEVLAGVLLILLLIKKFFDRTTLFLSIWFAFSIFAMLLSGRPYPHYVIQAIAPLSLIIANLIFGSHRYRFMPLPVVGLFLGSLIFYNFYYYPVHSYYKNFINFSLGKTTQVEYINNFDSRMGQTYEAAKYIVEHTNPKERMFIWGTEPELYALSRHVPPGRYITSFHIIDFYGEEETLKSLKDNPPKYILVSKNEKRTLTGFDKFLQENYLYIETIGHLQVWRKVHPAITKAMF